ncbi:outer membrane lipoprotein-sorting protein [Rahnella bruchi]|uniref:outer membrane lipoprotein-sorting protein n=1 Tax=Rahnella bruchi TaxID=1510573 RepID=UPI000EA0ACBE|nr:outer membrane lipoprotein-sorting protein [Rahnella bruchi]
MKVFLPWALISPLLFCPPLQAADAPVVSAGEIIKRADEIRSPDQPFRYTVTVKAYQDGASQPVQTQVLDISMRFIKPDANNQADARSLMRFVYPASDKGKVMLSDWYDLWFWTPELRRPIPISPQQRLVGQISNGDVIVTNFEYAYNARLTGETSCGAAQCYQLILERKSAAVTWPKIIYLVEKGSWRPFRADYLSLDDKVVKSVSWQDYRLLLDKQRPGKILVTDARHANRYSVMEYSDVRYESLPQFHFTKEFIQRGGR